MDVRRGRLICLGAVLALPLAARTGHNEFSDIRISLRAGADLHEEGGEVDIRMALHNPSARPVVLELPRSRSCAFRIVDPSGSEIWHSNEAAAAAESVRHDTLAPGERREYSERYRGRLDPGRYRIHGDLLARNCPLSANLEMTVWTQEPAPREAAGGRGSGAAGGEARGPTRRDRDWSRFLRDIRDASPAGGSKPGAIPRSVEGYPARVETGNTLGNH